jgi:citrate lyase subunit beta/citryl-CoA lyase
MVSVRVNPVGSTDGILDLEAVAGSGRVETVVIPKVEASEDLMTAGEVLAPGVGLEPLIETARGLANVEAIATATERVAALVFGPLDMSASLGLSALHGDGVEGYPGDPWHYARFRILVAARAAGARVVDGPFAVVDDLDGLRRSSATARALGYDAYVPGEDPLRVCVRTGSSITPPGEHCGRMPGRSRGGPGSVGQRSDALSIGYGFANGCG